MKRLLAAAALASGLSLASGAGAAVFVVDALLHSSDGGAGAGLDTVVLDAGDLFTVSVGLDDLWSAGALPRWSDADGLTGDRTATGSDESGEAAGVLIGADFGLLTLNGFSAPYGSLVGQIGAGPGSYRLLGTSFSGAAWASGTLKLFYWDTFTADNSGSVAADVAVVPEPAVWSMMIAGFGLAGTMLRSRRRIAPA
ncbi:MAG: PEPxxWA-CTERM sorting domain-containing protein [Phenylobacterium sp.]|uniref:PEPxxWA-CTERM sorting domain-containing protein n=1 Tax=Phenylobacterium sp. TaxID=1871053 RepID=UPI001A44A726|nr:PEPxxWA-CTERM sorting domain-containing protein [Phenylobacterium sp.]MBL8772513.1 PEPxxWA-CTERM sorting domain-containing protein [Phenylobacterium sp.]